MLPHNEMANKYPRRKCPSSISSWISRSVNESTRGFFYIASFLAFCARSRKASLPLWVTVTPPQPVPGPNCHYLRRARTRFPAWASRRTEQGPYFYYTMLSLYTVEGSSPSAIFQLANFLTLSERARIDRLKILFTMIHGKWSLYITSSNDFRAE